MSDVVVVAPSAPPEPLPPENLQATEAAAGAAVEIAQINADAQVETTRIMEEQATARTEIREENDEEDIRWLQGELDGLRARCATLEGDLSALRAAHLTMQEQLAELAGMVQVTATVAAVAATDTTDSPSTQEPVSPPPDQSDGNVAPTGSETEAPTNQNAEPPRRKRKLF